MCLNKKYESGQTVTEYALILGLVTGVVIAVLALLGPQIGDIYSQLFFTPEKVRVSVVDDVDQGVEGIWVYEFDGNGASTGNYGQTDASGSIEFEHEEPGSFQYLAYPNAYFWSDTISFPQQSEVIIRLATNQIIVKVMDQNGDAIKQTYVYALIANGAQYAGAASYTNGKGELKLEMPEGAYIFRAYYQGQYVSSDTVRSPSQNSVTIVIQIDSLTVQVLDAAGSPQKNVRVYAYTSIGDYVGLQDRTNKDGQASFNLAAGMYRFRADYGGNMYWSNTVDSSNGSVTMKID